MKSKRFIRKFVQRLGQEWLHSKKRDALTVNEIEILESIVDLLKEAIETTDKEREKILILEATEQLFLLPFISFKKS